MLREDGQVRCVACMMCPTVCPAHCITIVPEEAPDGTIEKRPKIFEIDELRCVVCGLCAEACPCDAIRMDTLDHAKPTYRRVDAILDKEELMSRGTVSTAIQGGVGAMWREKVAEKPADAAGGDVVPAGPPHGPGHLAVSPLAAPRGTKAREDPKRGIRSLGVVPRIAVLLALPFALTAAACGSSAKKGATGGAGGSVGKGGAAGLASGGTTGAGGAATGGATGAMANPAPGRASSSARTSGTSTGRARTTSSRRRRFTTTTNPWEPASCSPIWRPTTCSGSWTGT